MVDLVRPLVRARRLSAEEAMEQAVMQLELLGLSETIRESVATLDQEFIEKVASHDERMLQLIMHIGQVHPDMVVLVVEALKMMLDFRDGCWQFRDVAPLSDYAQGIVIGENPEALFRVRGDAHVTIPQARQRLGLPREVTHDRFQPPAEMPRFGDTVIFYQKAAVDWCAFWKMRCATTLARKADGSEEACFLIANEAGDRWLEIPQSADVTAIELGDVFGIRRRFDEGARADGSGTEHAGDRRRST